MEAIGLERGNCSSSAAPWRPPTAGECLQNGLLAQGILARITRRGVWLEVRPDDQWRKDLVKVLEALG